MTKKNLPIICLFLLFSILYSTLSLIHHTHFLSGAFDQGIFDQAIWQYAHFLSPYNTIKEKFILADHLTLTLPLLAPLYWIWDDVKIVLIFQAVWISFSVIPVYQYLLLKKFTRLQALLLSLIYILFYGMQYLVYFDLHSVAIGVGLLAWVLYFWEAERWRFFTASIILLLFTQENMGIALFGLCVFWFFQKKHKKLVLMLMGLSIIYTGLAFLAIKTIAQGNLQYVPQLPQTLQEFFTRFFDVQDKRDVWFFSFSWYSFLPLLSPWALIATTIDLTQYFTTGQNFDHMWSPYLHHRAILSLFLLMGTVDVLLFLKKKKLPITLVILCMTGLALFFQWHNHFILNQLTKSAFTKSEPWMDDNNDMLKHVPKTAAVAAQQSLVPHLAHRKNIVLLYPRKKTFTEQVCKENSCWWLDFADSPTLLVVDTHPTAWITMTLEDVSHVKEALHNMENSKVISLHYQKNEARIYTIDTKRLQEIQNDN